MKLGTVLQIIRIIVSSVISLVLIDVTSVIIALNEYVVFLIQLDSGMPGSVAFGVVLLVHMFFYSLLIVMIFVLWRFFAIPKDLGIVKKIRGMKSFYAPYFPSYYEGEDDSDGSE